MLVAVVWTSLKSWLLRCLQGTQVLFSLTHVQIVFDRSRFLKVFLHALTAANKLLLKVWLDCHSTRTRYSLSDFSATLFSSWFIINRSDTVPTISMITKLATKLIAECLRSFWCVVGCVARSCGITRTWLLDHPWNVVGLAPNLRSSIFRSSRVVALSQNTKTIRRISMSIPSFSRWSWRVGAFLFSQPISSSKILFKYCPA